ncbi:hypothetical protein T11_8150 [Trichinella zimbabwensis]|uniref:Uncharacterized protein n=1 Tax=Trichinella zimbabwensis TaxID=268475 RepID=A0A0V1I222_9BILA|nr:hypothetical protein T11_8150 [Trichinella zimbabwensis]
MFPMFEGCAKFKHESLPLNKNDVIFIETNINNVVYFRKKTSNIEELNRSSELNPLTNEPKQLLKINRS